MVPARTNINGCWPDIRLDRRWYLCIQNPDYFWGTDVIRSNSGPHLWYVKYKPIRDEALQMIKEIEGE